MEEFSAARAAHVRLGGTWFIDGELTGHAGNAYRSPVLPEEDLLIANVTPAEAQRAAESAARAQPLWAATSAMERARLVRELQSQLERRRDELVETIVLEAGKPLSAAEAEVVNALNVVSTFLASIAELTGTARDDYATGRRVVTAHLPVGPSLLISPWNFPLNLGLRKLVTALLAGCAAVWKPSERSPLTAMLVAECVAASGFPAGVVAVLPTQDSVGVVDTLLRSGKLRKLSFTGSTGVGRKLMAQAAEQLLRTSLELGGNGPAIVAPSADIEKAADAIVAAKLASNGQVCTSVNRLYVHRSVAEELCTAIGRRLDASVLGSPISPDTTVGPLISTDAVKWLRSLIEQARELGASVTTHGSPEPDCDRFIAPTMLMDVPADAPILSEELFGPVLPVVVYDELEDAITQAVDTPYGLSSYVFAESNSELEIMLNGMRSGLVAVNSAAPSSVSTPFGGNGWSGHGRENGVRGILEFLDEVTYVY